MASSSPLDRHAARQRELLQEEMQHRLNRHVAEYPVHLQYPAQVVSSAPDKPIRTNPDLMQHRLLEAGVMLEDVQKLGEVTQAVSKFISNLESSECYETVQVQIGGDSKEKEETKEEVTQQPSHTEDGVPVQTVKVVLKEKNWYSAYIGGGVKQDSLYRGDSQNVIPKLQFATRAKLLNLSGNLDVTSLNYSVDQTSTSTLSLQHTRPLFTLLQEYSPLYNALLTQPKGSQATFSCRALLDTVDHEWTRSYKEYQRLVSCTISNVRAPSMPEAVPAYEGLEWSLNFRDVVPRRHATLPYALDASPEVLAHAGPSVQHSVTYQVHSQEGLDSPYNPTEGLSYSSKLEVAGPPGDAGFARLEGGFSFHKPFLGQAASLHSALNFGILTPLSFGGLCHNPTCIADKFFVGGPMDLRGFVPAGIGPRAASGGASTPGGDALGGNFFYTATLAASLPFPAVHLLRENGVRLFGFCNVGTLVNVQNGNTPMVAVLKSTRASLGGGISVGTAFGRLEATYAWPLRYGPRDATKSVQVGLGFQFQ